MIDMTIGDGAYNAFDLEAFATMMTSSGKADGFAVPMYWTTVQTVCLGYSMNILEVE